MSRRSSRVFAGGTILTGAPGWLAVEALAVVDGDVVAAGTVRDARDAAGPGAEEIDLAGGCALPGFHDAHMHLATGALTRDWIDLSGCRDEDEAIARIASASEGAPAGAWLRGWGWDHTAWPGARWPTREGLDRVAPGRSIVLSRVDAHAVWVSSPVLARLGIARGTHGDGIVAEDVVRDRVTGEATGVLLERAADRAAAAVPPVDLAARRRALERSVGEASALGITSVDDVTEPWALELYQALREDHALPVRISAWLPGDAERRVVDDARRRFPPDDRFLAVTTLKFFLDGTLGSRSAALHAPYSDDPGTTGTLRIERGELVERLREADARDWAVALHAIGDRALSVALDALESLPSRARPRPHRIEHVQVARAEDLARIARVGALASIQPVHFEDDRTWIDARLGANREALAYPWRSLLRAGAMVAMGTDWPIAAMDPRRGLAAATTRAEAGGCSEALTIDEALAAYTTGSGRGRGLPQRSGALRPGFLADFTVLSADPRALPPERLRERTRVLATYVGGRQVHPAIEGTRAGRAV